MTSSQSRSLSPSQSTTASRSGTSSVTQSITASETPSRSPTQQPVSKRVPNLHRKRLSTSATSSQSQTTSLTSTPSQSLSPSQSQSPSDVDLKPDGHVVSESVHLIEPITYTQSNAVGVEYCFAITVANAKRLVDDQSISNVVTESITHA